MCLNIWTHKKHLFPTNGKLMVLGVQLGNISSFNNFGNLLFASFQKNSCEKGASSQRRGFSSRGANLLIFFKEPNREGKQN